MIFSMLFKAALGAACSLQLLGVAADAILNNPYPLLLDATLDELRHGLDLGLFTSVDLTKAYIARIKQVTQDLRPVNEINPDALAIAAEKDAACRAQIGLICNLGPLHGIPVLIKDNIATDDKMNNTAGSYALVGARTAEDSTVAARLRKAGAIILGKANMSQWANARSFNTSNGWSSYGGQTKGAYFVDQDPSGSSSGSAVSASLGLSWAALGTETDGSIISPANVNNLVGIKPTVGLTSRYLVVPISEHQDTVGPLARTVKDAAYLLAAIAGPDQKDNYTSAIPFGDQLPDYVAACKPDGLRGKRFGVARHMLPPGNNNTAIMRAFEEAITLMRAQGATIMDNVYVPGFDSIGPAVEFVLGVDLVTGLAKNYFNRLKTNPFNITNLRQLQDFTHGSPKEDWPGRDTGIWEGALSLQVDNTSPEFWGYYSQQQYFAGPLGVPGMLKKYSLDAMIMPADFVNSLPAIAGSPIITVPLGAHPSGTPLEKNSFGNLYNSAPNRPFGLAFLGAPFGEVKLIEAAYAFEQKTKVREKVSPYVRPQTELRGAV
jgi:amidase